MKNFIALDSRKVTDLYMILAEAKYCMQDYLDLARKLGHRSSFTDAYARRIKLAQDIQEFLNTSEGAIIEQQ